MSYVAEKVISEPDRMIFSGRWFEDASEAKRGSSVAAVIKFTGSYEADVAKHLQHLQEMNDDNESKCHQQRMRQVVRVYHCSAIDRQDILAQVGHLLTSNKIPETIKYMTSVIVMERIEPWVPIVPRPFGNQYNNFMNAVQLFGLYWNIYNAAVEYGVKIFDANDTNIGRRLLHTNTDTEEDDKKRAYPYELQIDEKTKVTVHSSADEFVHFDFGGWQVDKPGSTSSTALQQPKTLPTHAAILHPIVLLASDLSAGAQKLATFMEKEKADHGQQSALEFMRNVVSLGLLSES